MYTGQAKGGAVRSALGSKGELLRDQRQATPRVMGSSHPLPPCDFLLPPAMVLARRVSLAVAPSGTRIDMVLAVDIPLVAAWASVLATIVVALLEVRSATNATKVQRVVDLHRDLCSGEVGTARRRFSSFTWAHGERLTGRRICHRPTLDEIRPLTGVLGSYRADDDVPAGAHDAKPLDDLYVLLWCFERIETGLTGRALDRAMARQLLSWHAIWWDEATQRFTSDDVDQIRSLRRLARSLESPTLRQRVRRDFEQEAAAS